MVRFRIAMGFLWALLAIVLHVIPGAVGPAHAQGSRKDDIVFNSRGIPLAGATVRVCAMPATGQPCSPLALIYSDAALTQALANPTTTDGLGNYFFYAAPGKYEIEVSGPGITTKQLPNVILPNDPSSPTFTGGISAFSLTLSGNLIVNGSTTVVGNLASGTLNLSNQSTPPGAASSGTVNLYTKTADKRLYYKDDSGTEIGPVLPGAATNVTNTFTASQNFDADVALLGPNPYTDLRRYGGYGGSDPGTTASCTNGSPNITLAQARDFLDATKFPGTNVGHGIVIYGCGGPTGLSTPPAPGVVPFGVTGGSTTYNYQYVAEDLQGGLTAASPVGSTATGAAALGVNSVTLTQATWASTNGGTTTYTCSGNCNTSATALVTVSGFTGSPTFNGNFSIVSTPSGTTFTVYSPAGPTVTTDSSGGTLKVLACNILTMPTQSVPNTVEGSSSDAVMRWYVYRNGSPSFIVQKRDPYYEDCGTNTPSNGFPAYLPATPGAAQNKWLATTIVSGGGTTNIVVANNAGATLSGQTALHDNSQNLLAALNASHNSTPVYFTGGPFNATTVFTNSIAANTRLLLPFGVVVNQPWVLRTNAFAIVGGQSTGQTSFAFTQQQNFIASNHAYPGLLAMCRLQGPASASNCTGPQTITVENLNFQANNNTQIPVVYDMDSGFGETFLNDSFSTSTSASNLGTPAAWLSGWTHSQLGRSGDEWACAVPETILGPPCIRFTVMSKAEFSGGQLGVLDHADIFGGNMQGGTSFQFDGLPCINSQGGICTNSTVIGIFQVRMNKMLGEMRFGPFIRFGPGLVASSVRITNVDDDAPNGGNYSGFIDNAAGTAGVNITAEDWGSSVPSIILVGPGHLTYRNVGWNPGTTNTGPAAPTGGGTSLGTGGTVQTFGDGQGVQASGISAVGYQIATPTAPTVVAGAHSSCSSNCVASGTYYYGLVANDVTGRYSFESTATSVTVDGTQTVTVSWTPVSGQVTTNPFRGNSVANRLGNFNLGSGCGGSSYVDGTNAPTNFCVPSGYTVSAPLATTGNAASLSSAGVSGSAFNLSGGGFNDAISGTFTANRAQTVPDVTGYIPVTGYLNSAYDNATRANGAIGSNWTVTNNGINIASNNFVGTAGSNDVAYWSASAFSSVQFSQVTLTALNGTTDFPGVAVLVSGSGSSTQGYECVEDTTNIFIQKISGTSNATLTSAATTGAAGDILRLEAAAGGVLTCYKNGVSTLTATDTSYTSGSPGLFLFGTVATSKNWSGGNLHPIGQLDTEQDWTKTQHFVQGIALGGASSESFNNNPRAEQNVFLPGALTSTWTGSTWTTDKAVTITRVQVQAKTAPSGCTTNAVVRLTDGTTPVNVTISAAANDSGVVSQNYAAGSSLQVLVQTAAAGCTTSPADVNVTVQYRMQ